MKKQKLKTFLCYFLTFVFFYVIYYLFAVELKQLTAAIILFAVLLVDTVLYFVFEYRLSLALSKMPQDDTPLPENSPQVVKLRKSARLVFVFRVIMVSLIIVFAWDIVFMYFGDKLTKIFPFMRQTW